MNERDAGPPGPDPTAAGRAPAPGHEHRYPGLHPGGCAGRAWRRWSDGGSRHLPWPSALVVAVVQLLGSEFAGRHQPDRVPLDVYARLLLVIGPVLLLLRLRHPLIALFGTCAATAVYLGAGYGYGPVFVSVVVACFSAVVSGHRRAVWGAVGGLWACQLLFTQWLYRWLPPGDDGPAPWEQQLGVAAWVVAVLAASELARVRREQADRERAERQRAERLRVDEERLRIARELHDVLAHSISLIHVQAGVGLALIDTHPEQARTALTTIKSASKEALGEVRQVLSTLRAPGDAPRSPAPGLDRLPELTEQAGSAGLAVDVETVGRRVGLAPGADLAAFRVIQEALTNIVRHSGSRAARLRLAYAPRSLEIRVDDDGPAAAGGESGGNGLVGMRERVAALGGTLEAGPRPDGGFRVRAGIPLPAGTPRRGRHDEEEGER